MVDPSFIASGKVSYHQGDLVFRKGEAADRMYVILSGRVRLLGRDGLGGPGAEDLGAGDFFGEGSLLDGQPREQTAQTLEDAELLPINRVTLLRMLRQSPEVAVKMMRRLTQRLSALGACLESPDPLEAPRPSGPRLVSVFSGRPFPLPPEGGLVGRGDASLGIAPAVDLAEEDDTHTVSRRHARILREGDHYLLREEPEVLHGTFLRGERLGPGEWRELRWGDRVGFGMVVLFFEKA